MARTMSAIERINNIGHKSYGVPYSSVGAFGGYLGRSLSRASINLNDDKWSFALAYLYIETFRDCVDLYANIISDTPYILYQGDTELFRSDEPNSKSDLLTMLRKHRKQYYIDFFSALMYEMLLYDESVIELITPTKDQSRLQPLISDEVIGLRVLRGVATSLNFVRGELQSAFYSGDDDSGSLNVNNLIYDKGYHPLSDNYGASKIQSVLDEANITNALRNFLSRFLEKADRPDVVVGIENVTGNSTQVHEQLKRELDSYKRNKDETLFLSSAPMRATSLPRPDANNQLDVDTITEKKILRAFGVNAALLGDTEGTSYKDEHGAIFSNFIKTSFSPYVKRIDELFNDMILPRVFGKESNDLRFEHDLMRYDIVTVDDRSLIDATVAQFDAGTISLGQYHEILNTECPVGMEDYYKIEGILIKRDILPNLVTYKYQAPASEQWAQAQLNERQASVTVAELPKQEPPALPAPQENDDSEQVADEEIEQSPETKSITISHGDHDHTIPVQSARAYSHDKALAEIKAWMKFRKNDPSREFVPEHTLGDIADGIKARIADNADLNTVFDEAFDTVRNWQKSIQATRLSFENDFDDLMDKARTEGNNFGRVQWASALRSIIRRYGKQAYIDGLNDGGVLGTELSEADEDSIASIYREQSQYVTDLGKTLFKDDGISDALAEQKAAMWYRKSVQPFYVEGGVSANGNAMMEFAGNDGNESCKTCKRLKGQRHRYKTWQRKMLIPQVDTENFDCGGWQCEHKLVRVVASARGNF